MRAQLYLTLCNPMDCSLPDYMWNLKNSTNEFIDKTETKTQTQTYSYQRVREGRIN